MKYAKFKNHKIQRTCTKKFDYFRSYAPYLQKDFQGRCCYCNMSDELLTVSFHVEHFIPQKSFEGVKDTLKTDYNNLMWACPKCNLSKGNKYKGSLLDNDKIENELFYNPVDIDYNDIFYRNELGGIESDDPKGKEMIKLLKLYRPVHNFAWLLERLENLTIQLDAKEKQEEDEERAKILGEALKKAGVECIKLEQLFRAVYKGKGVFLETEYDV
ncbi:MAG: HNH endonuclease [Hungatella hathewayi]|mgnify:CR=1 FL=1|nr:HNH endonuclease [Hungatella hathewayi]